MARMTVEQRLNLYRQAQKTNNVKERQKQFKAIMKIADSRLRELEKIEKQAKMVKMAKAGDRKAQKWVELHHTPKNVEYFEGITNYAYQTAMHSLDTLNTKRFDIKASPAKERSLIAIAETFLGSVTSSKEMVKKSYKNRVDNFNSTWGTNLKWYQLEDFVNSTEFQDLMSRTGQYDSKTVAETYGRLRMAKNGKDIIKKIKAGADQTTFTDSPNDEIAKRLIKQGYFDEIMRV